MHKIPTLIIISGFSATGKTTLAKKISAYFSIPLISVDEIKETLFDIFGKWGGAKIFGSISRAAYEVMYWIVRLLLSMHHSLIVESFFRAEMTEHRIADLKKRYACKILQFQLKANVDTLINRYNERLLSGQRHPCHSRCIKMDELIALKGKSKTVKVDGETILIDTNDFKKVNEVSIFRKVKTYLN